MEYKPDVLFWLFIDRSMLAGLFKVGWPKVADCGCVLCWVKSMLGHICDSRTRTVGREMTMMDTFISSAVQIMVSV